MFRYLSSLFRGSVSTESNLTRINNRRRELAALTDADLKTIGRQSSELVETIAAAAVIAERLLGLSMFDVQLHGTLALTAGKVAEMQTGEGKTLAAVPAVVWYAKAGQGVHVMTVNDYLARRDANWMGPIYEFLGLSVGYVQQGMGAAERRRAYACDITYSTANEIGFDYLRDQLALHRDEQVHRPFSTVVIDEADSILIDEARIPLVIAGGRADEEMLAYRVEHVTRGFRRQIHYTVDEYGRNVALTDHGIRIIENAFNSGNLFAEQNLDLLTAVQDCLHARALLRRDVDYLVKNGAIESIDALKGRIAENRRWPAGLHTAIEAKEGLALKRQGVVLGSITLQNLIALYPQVCGMTGTASTQRHEFRAIYGLDVEMIPPNKPVIRVDYPDAVFATRRDKEQAVIADIHRAHRKGQPVLVGTTSVEESERLSAQLRGIPHNVLNARNDEQEAGIIALAGQRGAVTISTNMAGRGTDIRLGEGVADLGGLHVIGTNKHESRRIDNQLRGRAGRQGDPGSSRFLASLEDDLFVKYGGGDAAHSQDHDSIQRICEGQNLEIRRFLNKYEGVIEGQRQLIQARRQSILEDSTIPDLERRVTLTSIDDVWSDYLAAVAEIRGGIHWVSWGGRDPLHEYLVQVNQLFGQLEARIDEEISSRLAEAQLTGSEPRDHGTTWTYLTTDQPFGTMTERILRGFARKFFTRAAR